MEKYINNITLASLTIITIVMLVAAHWYFSLVSMAAIFIPLTLINIGQQPFFTTLFLLANALFPFVAFALVIVGWQCHDKKRHTHAFLYSILPLIAYAAILYGVDR